MAIVLSKENQDLISGMLAKVKYIENKLSELRKNRQTEVLVVDKNHEDAITVINNIYNPQIESLESEIVILGTELGGIK